MDSLPIAVPAALTPQRRPPVPFMAALVPVVAGVVLWLVTRSLYSLCFAALGPLMIFASILDGIRSGRKARRQAATEHEQAWVAAEDDLSRRRVAERTERWRRHPDALGCLVEAPLRGSVPPTQSTEIVIGSGTAQSEIRASGGDGTRERDFQARCRTIDRVPVVLPLGGGVAVRGPAPVAGAVARALVVQLCLRFGARQLALIGDGLDEHGLSGFPHAGVVKRGSFRLAVAVAADPRPEADAVVWLLDRGDEVPEGVTTVIDVVEPSRATLRTTQGSMSVAVECLSRAQTVVAAERRTDAEGQLDVLPDAVALGELESRSSATVLPAAIGRGERGDVVLDLVDDGPHAIVTGTTGSGKSELLVSWVTAIASQHGPDRVTFVLVDFKGGTAFEPLRALPQVVAVITDLDEAGTRRGVSSLTAELRRREAVLARAGARDVSEVDMSRLVIVVDEFAALLQEHSDLGAVFTDIAARGRALGMHLVLGTQRASGVIRDALAANCPLRVSLRVRDAADSRIVLGTDAAAELPGGVGGRGIALVRRPQDADPQMVRVALTSAADVKTIATWWMDAPAPRSPWLPSLPERLPLADLLRDAGPRSAALPEVVVIGRSDDPEHQRQPPEVLRVGADRGVGVLGAPGSGRTSMLRVLATQRRDAFWVPKDPEAAWDALGELVQGDQDRPRLVLCDDIDALLGDLPTEYAQALAQRWEQLLRGGAGTTFVLTAARSAGPAGRLLDALPQRALLRMTSRMDHLAAGGDAGGFDRERPPGRARIGEREVQVAWVDAEPAREPDAVPPAGTRRSRATQAAGAESTGSRSGGQQAGAPHAWTPRTWSPHAALTALVTSGAAGVAHTLAVAHPDCLVIVVSTETKVLPDVEQPVVLVGEPDVWQRAWGLWQRARREGEILIRAENPVELRQLAGVRELPPFARPHAGRAWAITGSDAPRRVVLSSLMSE